MNTFTRSFILSSIICGAFTVAAGGVGDEQGWWGLQDVTVDCVDRRTFRHWLRVRGVEKSKDYERQWEAAEPG